MVTTSHSQTEGSASVARTSIRFDLVTRRLRSGIAAGAIAVLGAAGFGGELLAQGVGLAQVGPVDPTSGYPVYYQDANGMRLQLCQDPGLCFYALPNPLLPASFPDNYPDEQFYYAIETVAAGNGAALRYGQALEAAFAGGAPAAGDQMVFTRFRLRVTGLTGGASYTVTYPYGQQTFVAGVDGALGNDINVTQDVGTVAGNFGLALGGGVGPFVTPLGFAGTAPGTFISDGATETLVQGSPFGTNFLRVDGPGIGALFPANAVAADSVQFDTFVIQGQIALLGGVGVTQAYKSKNATETAVNVWATASPGALLQVAVDGSLPVTMTDAGSPGSFFGRVILPSSANPLVATVTNLSDAPASVSSTNQIPDLVKVASAVGFVGGNVVVQAASTDSIGGALTITAAGLAPVTLPAAGGVATLPLALNGAVPPSITVTSASGGSTTVPVSVEVPTPVFANAGADQSVAAGAVVQLNGGGSTGPIVGYAWTHDAGALIALNGANTASPVFVAPTSTLPSTITLTLTVTGVQGQTSTDTVLVNVAAAQQAVLANAGADSNVTAGAAVTLSGVGSTGPITSFLWAQTAGTPVALTGANTASVSFAAPSLTTANSVTLTLTVADAIGNTSTDTVVVNVAAVVPPAQDSVAIGTARYVVNKNSWRVSGTATLRQGQQIRVYVGAIGDRTLLIGAANVGATGAWQIQTPDNSGPIPPAGVTTVWAESTLGGTPGQRVFTRN